MRSLKTIISDVKEVSGKKQSLENDLRQKKRKITDPYDLRQLIYGVLVISLPLTVWLLWIEWNEGIIYNPSWPLEIDHYPWYLQMISFVLTPIACIGVISVIVFVCIALVWLYIEEVFNKKFYPYTWISYFFFSKATHEHMRRIEANDFSNEPELAHIFAELEEKKQAYEVLQAEYELAEQEFQQRVKTFINSCKDEEVREALNILFLHKNKEQGNNHH